MSHYRKIDKINCLKCISVVYSAFAILKTTKDINAWLNTKQFIVINITCKKSPNYFTTWNIYTLCKRNTWAYMSALNVGIWGFYLFIINVCIFNIIFKILNYAKIILKNIMKTIMNIIHMLAVIFVCTIVEATAIAITNISVYGGII